MLEFMKTLKIATRQSPLALWQAEHIRARLQELHPDLTVELVKFVTQGDKILDTPLAKIGGKGLFVKELEAALLDGRADLAVHSMKDVPMALPEGLTLAVICEREDPLDAFVSNHFENFADLPQGAKVGTSSLRRKSQILKQRPDLQIIDLRGNVGTRLSKLDDGQYDAIILASAGLKRLGLEERIRHCIEPSVSLPAVGQGALGLECRADDQEVLALIQPLYIQRLMFVCVLSVHLMPILKVVVRYRLRAMQPYKTAKFILKVASEVLMGKHYCVLNSQMKHTMLSN